MTIIIFYKNGKADARIVSDVFVGDRSVVFNAGENQAFGACYDLDNIKKIMVDGVTVWEDDE